MQSPFGIIVAVRRSSFFSVALHEPVCFSNACSLRRSRSAAQLNVGKRRASKGVTERYESLWRSVGEVADFLCRRTSSNPSTSTHVRSILPLGNSAQGTLQEEEALLLPSPGRRVDEFVRHSVHPSERAAHPRADDFRIPVQALRVISATKPHDPSQPVELRQNRKLEGRAELRGGSERGRRPISIRQQPNSWNIKCLSPRPDYHRAQQRIHPSGEVTYTS